jgi:hypothetical protein
MKVLKFPIGDTIEIDDKMLPPMSVVVNKIANTYGDAFRSKVSEAVGIKYAEQVKLLETVYIDAYSKLFDAFKTDLLVEIKKLTDGSSYSVDEFDKWIASYGERNGEAFCKVIKPKDEPCPMT